MIKIPTIRTGEISPVFFLRATMPPPVYRETAKIGTKWKVMELMARSGLSSDSSSPSRTGKPLSSSVSSSSTRATTIFASAIVLAQDIKIAHSVFALPFAILAVFMARPTTDSWGRLTGQLVLIVGCMITGRTAAMLANRILDRKVDTCNPRTAGRAIASGRVALRHAVVFLLWSVVIFIILCAAFGFLFDNWWPFLLSIPVLAWICLYPLLKHVSWWCHAYLGASLALSPIAAAIAIDPNSISTHASIWWLAGMVLSWVAGFDIIYALQDVEVDRKTGINSIPARFGERKALWLSRLLHVISVGCLILIIMNDDRLSTIYFQSAITLVIVLLIIEHTVTARHGTGKIQLTFFTLNGIISIILGTAGIWSIVSSG